MTQPASAAGWFGKIPALGDFVARGLPGAFVDAWDEWLSAELAAAQVLLAEQFEAAYDRAPPWFFALSAGVVGPGGWAGLWLPSQDRVGRRFPLTFACAGDTAHEPSALPWSQMFEAARCSRAPGCGPDQIDAALLIAPAVASTAASTTAPVPAAALATLAEGASLWWPAAAAAAVPRCCSGLPAGGEFLDLLLTGVPPGS